MKVCVPLVPPLVVTVTVLAPAAAVLAITNFAVIDVALTTLTSVTVTFEPLTPTVAPVTKLVPVNVTETVLPCTPALGLTLVKVGAGGLTVKVFAPVVPPAVVTVTFRSPNAAEPPISKSAVSEVPLLTLTFLTVTFDPLTATVVEPEMKFVPVRVTETVVPCTPVVGLTAVSVGASGMTVNV